MLLKVNVGTSRIQLKVKIVFGDTLHDDKSDEKKFGFYICQRLDSA